MNNTVTHIVKAVSECKTYRETLRCNSAEQAEGFRAALVAEGWKVKVTAVAQ